MSCFSRAVQDNGLPAHIRSDLGGENIDLRRFMVEQHSSPNVVITGSSTQNERIERLWRDVYRCVGILLHNTFGILEDEGLLDSFNEVDMFCLHFVFLPLIQQTFDSFIESWNNHSIPTENNLTPNQLFIMGAIQYNITPQVPTASFYAASTNYSNFRLCLIVVDNLDTTDTRRGAKAGTLKSSFETGKNLSKF
uniref:Integrase core domain-containing protein n=1 Tax=Amphimedon queenslandica TaxID=400682 RepID=A0A1X7V400_AMPQE